MRPACSVSEILLDFMSNFLHIVAGRAVALQRPRDR
jgi:hypothetical protein